jgi:hypothetical protein
MNNYGKVGGVGVLAATGANIGGMNILWAVATVGALVFIGAGFIRLGFRSGKNAGQR